MSFRDRILAMLFASDAPLTVAAITEVLECDGETVERILSELGHDLDQSGPLQLVRVAGGYQLATKPEVAEDIALLLKPNKQRISKSLVEVLAVIAYRQPITLAEIEAVRGVQSDYGVKALMERRLIREVGRRRSPGRPMLYATTQQFLHHFQLESLSDLPPLQSAEPPGGIQPDLDQSVN